MALKLIRAVPQSLEQKQNCLPYRCLGSLVHVGQSTERHRYECSTPSQRCVDALMWKKKRGAVRPGRVYIQRLHEALKVKNVLGGALLLEQTFGLVMGIFERPQVNNG